MIIDDEQMILDMLRDQFEMEQYQVITAKSGEEALQKLTQQPDIILLDIASLRLSVSARLSPSSQPRGYGYRRNNSLSVELKLPIFGLPLLMLCSPFCTS